MTSFLTLNKEGILSAIILGVLLVLFGGSLWWLFLLLMLCFLIVSALVTAFKKKQKIAYGIYEGTRGWENVAANGVIPLIITMLYALRGYLGLNSSLLIFAFTASVAAITADKFSSELGVLQKKAIMLFSMRKVNAGTSGAVSMLGFVAGFFGALIIGIVAFVLTGNVLLLILSVVAGFFGDIVDSVFGYYEEKGVGNKYTTNILCSVSAAILTMILLLL
ncbi:MAG: DUF92 domain-containing protein [Candidatus Micrarchaeaceae archaeon]